MNDYTIKKEIIEIGKRLWQRGFIAANDGNLSVKLSDQEVICTPSGVSKGFMNTQMLIHINMENKLLQGTCKPTSEIKMHLEAFRQRPEIRAVVHAHPPYATSFAVANIPMDSCILPEVIVSLGEIPIAPYATPSTDEVPQSISELIKNHDALLLQNHGVLTVGPTLEQAYYKMETVEHSAQIYFNCLCLGKTHFLNQDEVKKLLDVRSQYGIKKDLPSCNLQKPSSDSIEKIVEDVLKKIKII